MPWLTGSNAALNSAGTILFASRENKLCWLGDFFLFIVQWIITFFFIFFINSHYSQYILCMMQNNAVHIEQKYSERKTNHIIIELRFGVWVRLQRWPDCVKSGCVDTLTRAHTQSNLLWNVYNAVVGIITIWQIILTPACKIFNPIFSARFFGRDIKTAQWLKCLSGLVVSACLLAGVFCMVCICADNRVCTNHGLWMC